MDQNILKQASKLAHSDGAEPEQMAALFSDLVGLAQQQVEELKTLRAERDKADQNLKASQAQLVQSGKMAAVGQLAAGVAHEVNNPLQIILSRVQLLMMRNQEHEPLVQDLKLIEANVKRISRIIRSLLDFARHNSGEEDWKAVELMPLIGQTAELMRHLMDNANIELTVNNETEESPILYGNVGEVEQVFLNLLINALQATPENGQIAVCAQMDGDDVVIRVSDTGKGIPQEDLSRIFEPFFTTRESQGGTGLGLAIISGIIEKHRGRIEVESIEGEGTTFILTFPTDASE
ncbi:MAG: GHKL domain-containing protein [Candidatus Latescibacteria bacterium]|jgi:two-component system, NtrC family, sensor kinase|nr:GHKL domain-containing protein [Candidatus Latescibacterota bacterium]